jgi:hypothetical protein
VLILLDEKAWGLWEEDQTDANDDGPQELNSYRDAVGAAVITACRGIVYNGGEEEALKFCQHDTQL